MPHYHSTNPHSLYYIGCRGVTGFSKVGGLKSQLGHEAPKKSFLEPPYFFPEPPHSGGALERSGGALKNEIFFGVLRPNWFPQSRCDRGGGGADRNFSKTGGAFTIASPPILKNWGGLTLKTGGAFTLPLRAPSILKTGGASPLKTGGAFTIASPPTLKTGGAEPPRAPPSVTPLIGCTPNCSIGLF